MFGLGATELIIIAVILLLIFGAKRLPQIGEGLGKTVKEVKDIKKELKGDPKPVAKKEGTEGTEGSEAGETAEASAGSRVAQTIEDKLKQKVIEQVPGLGQAKKLKDKADQIKKLVS
jgi:sec-independent protein translocase protein TatA